MSSSTSSPSSRLRLGPHSSPISASEVARNSIINSSAKGWSPLQINKRDSINQSPLKPSLSPDPNAPRRSSSSFKHVSKNSLVSNSPFKSPTTVQGAQAAGLDLGRSTDQVIHERRTAARAFGEAPSSAKGVGTTSKAAIGLGIGISPSKPRRSTSGGNAVNGQRKVSIEKSKVAFPGIERRSSTERRVSASKENESPDVRASKRVPRASMGFKDLAKGTLVTKSPFKRVPSGGLSSTSSSKANEHPAIEDQEVGPSPKTIPVERDDVFSSPSPRRTSASRQQQQRRASPSASLGVGSRRSVSPTPSPPRSVPQPLLTTTLGSAGPSPLSKSLSIPSIGPTPTPTPHKSAMTPSRRLRGPRDLAAGLESPTRKTVTFQSVPDVKEFETMSAEPSMDGSFEVNNHDDDEEDGWVDEAVHVNMINNMSREDSLDELLSDAQPIFESSANASPVFTEENDGHMPEDSTTANFMDTLIEEGLFSPPTMDTPAFEDQAAFELPLEPVDGDSDRPFLATPSLGGSVHASPLLASSMFGETDSAGIPYGRTHHTERAAIAHSLSPPKRASPIEQPGLPRDEDHKMLLNANAAQPAVPIPQSPVHYPEYNDPFASTSVPHAHQVGAIPDPFITLQTATNVLPIQHQDREEDGIPLGRTSHTERLQARRMLATQSLGLGMPRSPAISQGLTRQYSEEEPSEEEQGDRGEIVELSEAPVLAPPVARTASQESEEGVKRRLPKIPAPAPMPVDIPSPVTSPNKEQDTEKLTVAEKRTSKFDISGFSLPFIGSTSPFFNSAPATFEKQPSIDGHSTSSNEPERPLTPPTAIRDTAEEKKESPHRLPDMNFHFEEIQLQRNNSDNLKRTATIKTNPVSPIKVSNELKKDSPIKEVVRPTLSTSSSLGKLPTSNNQGKLPTSGSGSSLKNDFGSPSSNESQDSTTTRVRQRISREMIRETINQRIADGSLSRRPASSGDLSKSLPVSFVIPDIPLRQRRTSGVDKDLPPPPPNESPAMTPSASQAEELAPKMTKAHTTDNANSKVNENRPTMRPRSQTQSAHEVLKQNEKDGILNEPKSALDKLASSLPSSHEGSQASIQREVSGSIAAEMPPPNAGRPISILKNPYPNPNKQEGLLPPADVGSSKERGRSPSPSGEGMKGRENAIIAKRRDRNVSGVSTGSRRSRRSLSMGDVDKEAEQAKQFRRKNTGGNPRLTLGIDDDQQSILDAFREEITQMDRGYKVREKAVVRASYHDKIRHNKAGDIDQGKAWKQLRRPSDMNEHAAEIRAMRARESTSGKASGTIFVKVLGIEGLQIPLPDQPTYFCITLDNGIDYIRTPYSVLGEGAKVNQEFSLVEQPNFEFSLSLDIRRDPHILKMLHQKPEIPQPIPAVKRPQTPSSPSHKSGGFRSLFASPRKPKASKDPRSTTPQPILPTSAPTNASTSKPIDNIVKYLSSPSGSTIAKTHIAFKPIAKNCESRVLEIRYPMFAISSTAGSSGSNGQSRKQLGKITLQIFRLPPIPGLKGDELPQCIDEALRGMRHHAWHEHEYHEGVLTQEGGDCTMPKRRLFKLIGGNLVAINEVTKKEVTKIDLRQAVSVIDLNAQDNGTPKSRMTMRPRSSDEGLSTRPRSFMLEFKDGEGISFAADNDNSKEVWMQTLEGLIGKIPSNPLWAELLATRQRERAAKRTASSSSLAKDARRQASGTGNGRPVSMPLGAASKTR
uniref:PH domain-containing protein n=1 Tax=Kwoniella bestiolae CBS 10118 TaxID=1296100 RepID=A0A1B9G9J4_9TREE|nr:hypothetical protein I302_02531 [Kwoniella bestiolae CBS 10118]OCF27687.1 hypothetical protein I302_02531 [Kwoniella bestiolae CBS 10118]